MTCEPFCDSCGGNLGHVSNGDFTCSKCIAERLAKGPKKRIRKDEFEPGNPDHFRLPMRRPGGGYRYYVRVDKPVIVAVDPASPGGDMSVRVTRRGNEVLSIERFD